MLVVVDFNKEKRFLDFLLENIEDMENELDENLEYDEDNFRYKKRDLDYSVDLNNNERKIALNWLSSKSILLMKFVLKLHVYLSINRG
ncbi:MAG: hypothetical protein FWH29_05470 [Methanobrevibacter sp.]|nr:hypothetical protein [Methanobrevibacter sp.]